MRQDPALQSRLAGAEEKRHQFLADYIEKRDAQQQPGGVHRSVVGRKRRRLHEQLQRQLRVRRGPAPVSKDQQCLVRRLAEAQEMEEMKRWAFLTRLESSGSRRSRTRAAQAHDPDYRGSTRNVDLRKYD